MGWLFPSVYFSSRAIDVFSATSLVGTKAEEPQTRSMQLKSVSLRNLDQYGREQREAD